MDTYREIPQLFSCLASSARGRFAAFALALLMLGGCASPANPRDPLEPFNRAIYSFNDGFDRVIAKPVAEGYRSLVPGMVRTGVTNFFSNLGDLWIAANNLLQGKVDDAANDFGRVVINTTIGLFGLIDVASEAGLEKHNEDFGQTLGRWGVASGPYIVLPFLGPSTVRDALGYGLVDTQADFVVQTDHVPTRNTLFTVRAVDARANLLDASRVLEEAALDKYSFLRDAFIQRRQNLVYDGNPPREDLLEDKEPAEGAKTSQAAPAPLDLQSMGGAPAAEARHALPDAAAGASPLAAVRH